MGGTSPLGRIAKKPPGGPRNTNESKNRRHDIIMLLRQLRCQYNMYTGHNKVSSYLIQLW